MLAKYPGWSMADEYRRFVERKEVEETEWAAYDEEKTKKAAEKGLTKNSS
jgi:hypothetical protein